MTNEDFRERCAVVTANAVVAAVPLAVIAFALALAMHAAGAI